MRIFVKEKPNAKETIVRRIDETHFEVSVKEPPVQGRANEAIVGALAGYFNISLSQIQMVSGWSSRNKIFDVHV